MMRDSSGGWNLESYDADDDDDLATRPEGRWRLSDQERGELDLRDLAIRLAERATGKRWDALGNEKKLEYGARAERLLAKRRRRGY